MIPVTIQKMIEIAATAQCIWPYVGTEAGLRQWWGLDIALEEKQGGHCEERSLVQNRVHYFRGQVTVYAPPHQLALLLHNADAQESWPLWMTISITLAACNGRTQVTLLHQTFGSLSREAAVGAPYPLPSTGMGPQARWTGQPPQNSRDVAPVIEVSPPPLSTFAVDHAWLARYDATWNNRLHALANQVRLNLNEIGRK